MITGDTPGELPVIMRNRGSGAGEAGRAVPQPSSRFVLRVARLTSFSQKTPVTQPPSR